MATYRLTRDIPVDESYDILVAGGGPAGSAAAVCAARLGAKVLLVEANGCLGGMGTSGLVSTFGPVSDGKRMLVGGFMKELIESMYQRGDLGPHVVPNISIASSIAGFRSNRRRSSARSTQWRRTRASMFDFSPA
jgi:choline dehydrogenase-like flavoprotein